MNLVTSDDQRAVSLTADGGGGFVLAWESIGQDGQNQAVLARRFSSTGVAQASEFLVNTYTTNDQSGPSVSADADGDFVVAWSSFGQDGQSFGIFARRFSSAGSALASEFQVNTYTPGAQYRPTVAMDAVGDFVVAWESDGQDGSYKGVFARRFSNAGAALASEFQVNTYTTLSQRYPSLAAGPNGDFVVVWRREVAYGSIFGRRFSSAGAPLANEFQVNTSTSIIHHHPWVAADGDGDFIVAWQSLEAAGYGVFVRRFSSGGTPLATEFQANAYTPGDQNRPSVAAGADGDFVVAWQSYFQDGEDIGIFARRFSSTGAALASEFQVNTYTADDQRRPGLAARANGDFVVGWASYGQDGSSDGVFAQRFAVPRTLDVDASGSVAPLTDGLLLLRYLFGFRGVTLTNGAIGGGCARCDAASIEAYLAEVTALVPLAHEVRLGGEFQVNAFTMNGQSRPVVAAEAGGDFVVVWQSPQAGVFQDVFARRFSSTGASLASEFQVNTYTSFDQTFPSLASDSDGDFVVAWKSNQDGSSGGVFARRYSSTGVALATELQVNTYTADNQDRPSIAADVDGDFVVSWLSAFQDGSGYGIFTRRFSSAGAPQTAEIPTNPVVAGDQRNPSVAVEAAGDFVVAWQSNGEDGDNNAIIARRFSGTGVGLASEFQVNAYVTSSQYKPSVAADNDGDFVIAWQSYTQDGSSLGVFARRFSSAGTTLANEFQVNTYTSNGQGSASVSADADGDFVVAWVSYYQDGAGGGVFARRFSSTGAALASEFQVSAYTSGAQGSPSVTQDARGHFVIAWDDDGGRDGSGFGVFAQRFLGATITVDIDGNGAAEPLTDGLLALRYLFGFRGVTLTSGAVGADCTRCDAAAIESHLAGLT